MTPPSIPVFDGHNDVLLRLHRAAARGRPVSFLERDTAGHLDLPRAREGGFAGGMFACFTPSREAIFKHTKRTDESYDVPLPKPPSLAHAQRVTMALAAALYRIEAASGGGFKVVRDVGELRACLDRGVAAAVFHIEGAEAIDTGLDALEVLYRAGLRSLGVVWSRPNAFGHGVPFRFPSSPDTGPGLTEAGKALVRGCNELGIMIDLSHMNEQGFWDVAKLSQAPLVASHSCVHAICPVTRNLTDDQLAAIRDSGGMVGINFAVNQLRPDGKNDADTPLEVMARHLDHLIERLGEDGVGFGSDFDGATVPKAIGDAAGLPRLIEALRAHGYDDALLEKLCHANWLSVLERTWAPGAD